VAFVVRIQYKRNYCFVRFTQAGSEVSALLGRIPSAVGYQPTLATDMGTMQERITTTKKGSITSVQVWLVDERTFCMRYQLLLFPAALYTLSI